MSDIVERLRKHEWCIGPRCENKEVIEEAADTIEQLRKRRQEDQDATVALAQVYDKRIAELESELCTCLPLPEPVSDDCPAHGAAQGDKHE